MRHSQSLIDDAQCLATVRARRWPDGVRWPSGERPQVTTQGRDVTHTARQRSRCTPGGHRCDEVTDPICAGQQQPRRVWIVWRSWLGLHVSTDHRAQELARHQDDVPPLTGQRRQGMVTQKPTPTVTAEVEADEVSVVAGHQGTPHAVGTQGGTDGDAASRAGGDVGPVRVRTRRSSA